jgi:uncharacterized cupredoxin-like copper-binding protein
MSVMKSLGRRIPRVAAHVSLALLLTLGSASVSTAAAEEIQTVTVVLTENRFAPGTITLTAGKPVLLNIQNQGHLDHSLLSDIPVTQVHYQKADNTRGELQSYEKINVINADAGSGHTSAVMFTPTRAGMFEFHSEGEEDLGLAGNFLVVGAGGQAATQTGPAASAPPSNATVAMDGQSLASQSAATQSMFTAVWGDRAALEWVREHNAALSR